MERKIINVLVRRQLTIPKAKARMLDLQKKARKVPVSNRHLPSAPKGTYSVGV